MNVYVIIMVVENAKIVDSGSLLLTNCNIIIV